nr:MULTISPECIES: acyltransferase [unclassified Ciceribacter]
MIDVLRRHLARIGRKVRASAKTAIESSPARPVVSKTGLFQGNVARSHPAVKCGESILDKGFGVEFRTDRNEPCVEIGNECILKCKIIFETDTGSVKIGDGCYIGGTRIISAQSVEIGNWVTMAWGIMIYDHNSHSLDFRERINDQKRQLKDWGSGNFIRNKNWDVVDKKPIRIGDYAWIGFDAVILKGVTIGEGAVVGARSVVTRDVEPWTVVAGNPAQVVKRLTPGEPLTSGDLSEI